MKRSDTSNKPIPNHSRTLVGFQKKKAARAPSDDPKSKKIDEEKDGKTPESFKFSFANMVKMFENPKPRQPHFEIPVGSMAWHDMKRGKMITEERLAKAEPIWSMDEDVQSDNDYVTKENGPNQNGSRTSEEVAAAPTVYPIKDVQSDILPYKDTGSVADEIKLHGKIFKVSKAEIESSMASPIKTSESPVEECESSPELIRTIFPHLRKKYRKVVAKPRVRESRFDKRGMPGVTPLREEIRALDVLFGNPPGLVKHPKLSDQAMKEREDKD